MVMGSETNFAHTALEGARVRQLQSNACDTLPVICGSSQLSMSDWVRESQMAMCRCAQLALAEIVGSPAHAAMLSRVSLANFCAPAGLNVMLTSQTDPDPSMAAVALAMSRPVRPVSAGL